MEERIVKDGIVKAGNVLNFTHKCTNQVIVSQKFLRKDDHVLIVVSGLQMIGNCGYTHRTITIAALSLSVGLGFTQVPEMFSLFPDIIYTIFAENCVAVVFVVSIILNLVIPKEKGSKQESQTQINEQSETIAQ